MEDNETKNEEKTTYTLEEVEAIKKQMQDDFTNTFDDKFKKSWAKEKSKIERENAKKDELINLIKSQTGADSMEELLDLSYEQYEVERPTSTKDDEILGKHDAKELLELDDYEEIENEANRLSQINRNARENAEFMELASYLQGKKTELKRKNEIKEAGLDENILNDPKFNDFLSKFNEGVKISDAYDLFQKINPKQEPFNTGSLQDKKTTNEEAYFTKDEFMALTDEDLKNPIIYKKAMESKNFF